MNAAIFTKSTTGLILASGLIAASSVLGHAQDAPIALGTLATSSLSSAYATVPTGQATLGGHTFDMTSGTMLQLANGGSASFAGSYQNPKAVHLLLNTANTYSWMYAGNPVGSVVLTFSDGTTQSATLTSGGNVREWLISAYGVVNDVTDITPNTSTPYVTKAAWTTTAVGGTGTAVLDMLTVPVWNTNSSKTLTGVQLNDNNTWGSLQIDLAGLTVEFTPPAPQATCNRPGNSVNIAQACANSEASEHAKSANFTGTSPSQGKSTNSADAGMNTPAMTKPHATH
jgi:hypothetical protein